MSRSARTGMTLREMVLVILIVGALAAVAIPNFRAARERDNNYPRSCYAFQKTIVGAMEMYNLDKNTKRVHLDLGFFQALQSGGYLPTIPQDPGAGPGSESNFQSSPTGNGITCIQHGPIQMERDSVRTR